MACRPLSFAQAFACGTVRAFAGVSPLRFAELVSSHTKGCDVLRLLCPLLTSVIRSGPVARFLSTRQYDRSPGVNTHLSAHERRVYLPGLRWIEDFTLCYRIVPPGPPDSVLVHRPVRLRYPTSVGRPPPRTPSPMPGCHTATSFASIGLDQGLAKLRHPRGSAHP